MIFFTKFPEWYVKLELNTGYKCLFSSIYGTTYALVALTVIILSWIWHIEYTMRSSNLIIFLVSILSIAVGEYLNQKICGLLFGWYYQRFISDKLQRMNYIAFCKVNRFDKVNSFTYQNSWMSDFKIDINKFEQDISKELKSRREIHYKNEIRIVCWKSSVFKSNQEKFRTQFVYFIRGKKGFHTIDWEIQVK